MKFKVKAVPALSLPKRISHPSLLVGAAAHGTEVCVVVPAEAWSVVMEALAPAGAVNNWRQI